MISCQIVVYDPLETLLLEGVKAVVKKRREFDLVADCKTEAELIGFLGRNNPQILIFTMQDNENASVNLLNRVRQFSPEITILAITQHIKRETVFRAIKSGTKGLLSSDSTECDLIQALFTIRNGYDYFSKPITELLISDYIDSVQNGDEKKRFLVNELSKREREVLTFWALGYTNKEIADELFISVRTVESHKNHIMQKLNLKTTVDMVKFAIRNNIIEI